MKKIIWLFVAVGLAGGVHLELRKAEKHRRVAAGLCAEPASRPAQAQARAEGMEIDSHGCILAPSAVQDTIARAAPAALSVSPPPANLALARAGFSTRVVGAAWPREALPVAPPELFVRSDYASGKYLDMPAYVSPDPKDGKRHPAIIWLSGGDFSSFGKFWEPGSPDNDQSARQFREAGLVMMFPSLRGSANNASRPEFFFGEVDDVLAAAEHLARLPYVDPQRIYLGGHSTGGTLALLVAESSPRFKAVFALGPVEHALDYPRSLFPLSERGMDAREARLRSPVEWLAGISTPTFLIEGMEAPGNAAALDALCKRSSNPLVQCIAVPGQNHFSVIAPAARVIAAKLAIEVPGIPFSLRADQMQK